MTENLKKICIVFCLKIAEKRKSLLDELSIKYQEEYDAHRENLAKMEAKHLEVVDGLKAEMAEKSVRV